MIMYQNITFYVVFYLFYVEILCCIKIFVTLIYLKILEFFKSQHPITQLYFIFLNSSLFSTFFICPVKKCIYSSTNLFQCRHLQELNEYPLHIHS